MAQEDKENKKKSLSSDGEISETAKKSSTKNAKEMPPKDNKIADIEKQAEQSLMPKEEKAKNSAKKLKEENSGLSSYEEQALQGVTKSKGNKKVLIIVFLILGLIAAGVGIALFFMLKPEEEPVEAVICEVEVISYYVENNDQIVIGDSDKFNFTEKTQETSNFTKDLETNVSEVRDIALVYLVNNTTSNNYVYTFDFSELVIENCKVVLKVSSGETLEIGDRRYFSITKPGDIVLEIRISMDELPPTLDDIPEYQERTKCEGGISLTLALE